MKKLLAISLVLAPTALVTGCFIQTAPPPEEPAPAATTAAPAPAATPAPTAEEPAKPPMGVPKLGSSTEEEKKTE